MTDQNDSKEKRRPGEGSIERLPSGRCRARLVLADGVRYPLGTHSTYEEAEGVIAGARVYAAGKKLESLGTGVTLRGFGPRFLDEFEQSHYTGIVSARSAWNLWIVDAPFIDWPIRRIGRKPVERWLKSICRKHIETSDSWFRQILHVLRKCFHAAVEHDILESNPITDLHVPKRDARTEEAWTYLTLGEQEALFSHSAIPEWFRLSVAFVVGAGLRGSEFRLLHLEDLHLDDPAPYLTVRYGSRRNGKLKAPKGRRIRHLPLLPVALDALRRWLEILPTWAPRNPLGLAFPAQRGGYRKLSHWPGWAKHLGAAGIKRRVRPHDLRHTCGSALVSGMWGEPWALAEVRDFLGHRSIQETERYAHLAPEALNRSAAKTRWSSFKSTPEPRNSQVAGEPQESEPVGSNTRFRDINSNLSELYHGSGSAWLRQMAERLLRAAAAGEECSALLDALAAGVLATESVQLAAQIRAGGPHALDRGIELAALLLGHVEDQDAEVRGA